MNKRNYKNIDTTPVTMVRLVPRADRDACVAAMVTKNYFVYQEEVFDDQVRLVFMSAS